MWDAIIYPFPNFNDYTVEIWERVSTWKESFTHFTGHVITYPRIKFNPY